MAAHLASAHERGVSTRSDFQILMGLFLVALAAVLPVAAVEPPPANPGELAWPVLFAIDALVASLLAALAIFLGLRLGARTGLGALSIDTTATAWARTSLPLAAVLGLGFGLLTAVSLATLVSASLLPSDLFSEMQRSVWKGVLVSLSAGIKEELLLRFGLMTVLAWIMMKLSRREHAGTGAIWIANIVAALIFGLAHLPAASTVTEVTPVVVAVALVFNGIAGLLFGWLYWRRGIFAAIAAHFFADIVLQVLYPLVAGAGTQ